MLAFTPSTGFEPSFASVEASHLGLE
jgi:hypothetical protein